MPALRESCATLWNRGSFSAAGIQFCRISGCKHRTPGDRHRFRLSDVSRRINADPASHFHREGIPARRRPVYDSGMINETAIRARYGAIKDRLDERVVACSWRRKDRRRLRRDRGGVAGDRCGAQHDHSGGQGSSDGASDDGAGAAQVCRQTGAEPVQPSRAGRPAPLVELETMGDPMRPLLWVSKSREKLASALRTLNHAVWMIWPGHTTRISVARSTTTATFTSPHWPGRCAGSMPS
jgi:hypothetical protein